MESSPNDLGWVEPSLKFGGSIVNLVRYIGMGRISIVYEGKHACGCENGKKCGLSTLFSKGKKCIGRTVRFKFASYSKDSIL
jgi:hypothetical protein